MLNRARFYTQALLTGFMVAVFIIVASTIDTLPIWILLILAVAAWVWLLMIMIRDLTKKPTLYYNVDGVWYPVEPMTAEEIIAEQQKEEDMRDERLF